ncbi:MAG: DUF1326 domain-containing protein [Hyphomicrobiales bacterium]
MTWQVSGRSLELCSCKSMCPCWLGPDGDPDQEWCAAIFGFDVENGTSNGVDLAGSKLVLMLYWPANFFSGNGSARLYLDAGSSADQQKELEGIFCGRDGGMFEGLWGAVLKEWHPSQVGNVELEWGDSTHVKVDGIGQATLKPFQDGAGNTATISGTAAQAAFQMDSMELADGRESSWSDPDLGNWQGDSGTLHRFNLSS